MNNDTYEFSSGTKRNIFIVIGAGLALFILGIIIASMSGGGHHGGEEAAAAGEVAHHGPTLFTRIMANLWLDNIYFIGIAVIGVFFVALQYAAQSGWFTTLLRIPMSFGYYLPIGG